jgi:hypothetical protein
MTLGPATPGITPYLTSPLGRGGADRSCRDDAGQLRRSGRTSVAAAGRRAVKLRGSHERSDLILGKGMSAIGTPRHFLTVPRGRPRTSDAARRSALLVTAARPAGGLSSTRRGQREAPDDRDSSSRATAGDVRARH